MKLWELGLAIGGAICLLLGTAWIRRSELPRKDFVLDAGSCRVPVTEYDPPANVSPAGSAIVLHGLSANRRVMTYLSEDFAGHGLRTYALDLPGHGDNREPFTFPRAQLCANAAVETLIRNGKIDPRATVLVGHSMGAAIAIRMADREPVLATIAISPAPMKLPMRMPANLLVFTAQFDIPPLAKEAKELQAAAGGDRNAPEDFAQLRAFDLERIPFASHTSLLLDRRVAHRSELWAMRALFPNVATETLTLNVDLATYETFNFGRRRLAGAVLGLVGLVLLFPIAASAVVQLFAQIFRTAGDRADSVQAGDIHRDLQIDSSSRVPGRALILVEGIVAALIGVAALILFIPLKFLHLYSGDYLASLLLIYGALLLILESLGGPRHIFAQYRDENRSYSAGHWHDPRSWGVVELAVDGRLAQCAEVAAVLRASASAMDLCLCGGGGARAREYGRSPDDSVCTCDGAAAGDLAHLRFCVLRALKWASADSAFSDRARNVFDLSAARY